MQNTGERKEREATTRDKRTEDSMQEKWELTRWEYLVGEICGHFWMMVNEPLSLMRLMMYYMVGIPYLTMLMIWDVVRGL